MGKTFFSNLIIKSALQTFSADQIAYYKPIQCGKEFSGEINGYEADFEYIKRHNPGIAVYNSYFLSQPAAPIIAANSGGEKIDIDLSKIEDDFKKIKSQHKFVIVEGAGGLVVPIKENFLVSDLIKLLDLPLLLIIGSKLGTINHSLLSIEHAKSKNIELLGFVMSNREPLSAHDSEVLRVIENFSNVPHLHFFNRQAKGSS